MHKIQILPGINKTGQAETFEEITLCSGSLLAVVGNTGAGKSRLIQDIEQLVHRNSVSKRIVTLDGKGCREEQHQGLIAHLGQNMRFMLDTTVEAFLTLHNQCRNKQVAITEVLQLANTITAESVQEHMLLNLLSGGQSRALMIADIALICDSPIVLIDEIENAGIDKVKALQALLRQDKLVIMVTHDPHTALMAEQRIVMQNGGIMKRIFRSEKEKELYEEMSQQYQRTLHWQQTLRQGGVLA